MTFPVYPTYKKTGIEWPKEAPPHWPPIRLKFAVRLNPSKSEIAKIDRFEAVTFLPMEAIGEDGSISLEHSRPIAEVETGYTYFRDGDVTIAKITPCFENGKGAVMQGLLGGIGFGTTELIVARPLDNKVCPEFLHSIFNSDAFRGFGQASMYGAGGQKRVPDDFVRNFRAPIPPLSEQQAVQRFINSETIKIDALVTEQKRLIELLDEKRQAVIAHAVTKGLDASVTHKESGVEWLGRLPTGWRVVKLGQIGVFKGGAGFPEEHQGQSGLEIPFFKVADLAESKNNGALQNAGHSINRVTAKLLRAHVFPTHTIVFAKVGAALMLQRYRWLANPACIDNNMMGLTLSDGVLLKFMLYVLPLLDLSAIVNPGAVPSINEGQISNQRVPLPSSTEQKAIVDYLDYETARFDSLIAETEHAIRLLRERRTSLVSAAVTGQIDVRNLEAF